MAKQRGSATSRVRRGGRKPGSWTETTPDAIHSFRATGRVSRSGLAAVLGVSPTSVQNWEVGQVVATPAMQRKIKDVLAAGAGAIAGRPRGAPRGGPGGPELVAVGSIVVAWLEHHPRAAPDEVLATIRVVRAALA